jgi:kynurenine formamidase
MEPIVIDLSQSIFTGMQVFPLHSPTHLLPWAKREAYGFASEALFCNSHAGTHVDAPYHFIKKGQTIDQLPLDRFYGPALALDLTSLPARSHISAQDLQQAAGDDPIQPGEIVLLRTGIDTRLGQPEYLSDYSGLSEEGARYLVEQGVKAVGTDAPGIDHPEATTCPAHHVLLPAGLPIYENLANLATLIEAARGARFTFHGQPLKLRAASGSPVRALAVLQRG